MATLSKHLFAELQAQRTFCIKLLCQRLPTLGKCAKIPEYLRSGHDYCHTLCTLEKCANPLHISDQGMTVVIHYALLENVLKSLENLRSGHALGKCAKIP